MKKSKWFPMTMVPTISGVYEVHTLDGMFKMHYWAGLPWRTEDLIRLKLWWTYAKAGGRWRGLAEKPK